MLNKLSKSIFSFFKHPYLQKLEYGFQDPNRRADSDYRQRSRLRTLKNFVSEKLGKRREKSGKY